jgi:single-strand DNA-binding protein
MLQHIYSGGISQMASKTYEIEGRIKTILDAQTFASGFTKRDFVITTEEEYPQDVKLECIKDRCSLLEGMAEGDRVLAAFNLRGNEYNGRYFVNLQAWRLAKQDGATAAPAAASTHDVPLEVMDDVQLEDADDAPF